MRVSEKLIKALNDQYNFELQSGYEYLGMVHDFKDKDWEGFAHFMDLQSKEEYEHAEKFQKFIESIDGRVELYELTKPRNEYSSVKEVFETALGHEKLVTSKIEALYEMALEEKSYVVVEFLNWFLKEQVEEEDTMRSICSQLDKMGDSYATLHLYDIELGRRE